MLTDAIFITGICSRPATLPHGTRRSAVTWVASTRMTTSTARKSSEPARATVSTQRDFQLLLQDTAESNLRFSPGHEVLSSEAHGVAAVALARPADEVDDSRRPLVAAPVDLGSSG